VNSDTGIFTQIKDLKFLDDQETVSGLIIYIVDYLKSKAMPLTALKEKIQNIDVRLTNRIGGFVDQGQQKYLLDSKNPRSTTSSVFVPSENYNIIFNISSPISSKILRNKNTNINFKISATTALEILLRQQVSIISQR
jgi:hypothetical protein